MVQMAANEMLSFTGWEGKHKWAVDVVHAEADDEQELLRGQTGKLRHVCCDKQEMQYSNKGQEKRFHQTSQFDLSAWHGERGR